LVVSVVIDEVLSLLPVDDRIGFATEWNLDIQNLSTEETG
jgi:hypothetical protein